MLVLILTLCVIYIVSVDISHVVSMNWIWLDSQHIIGSEFWPFSNPDRILHALAGRDRIGYGLFYHILTSIIGVNDHYGVLWQYGWNYIFHLANCVLVGLVVWNLTKNSIASLGATLISLIQSSGPEVFLNVTKNEHFGVFWILVGLAAVTSHKEYCVGEASLRVYVINFTVFATTVLGIGLLGKEPLVFHVIGIIIIDLMEPARRVVVRSINTRLSRLSVSLIVGIIGYSVYRYYIGISSPLNGSYSGGLIYAGSFRQVLTSIYNYSNHSSDVIIVVLAAFALQGILSRRTLVSARRVAPGFDVSIRGVALGSLLFLVFHFLFVKSNQVYYLYPAGVLSAVPLVAGLYECGRCLQRRLSVVEIVPLVAGAILSVYVVVFAVNRWGVRSDAITFIGKGTHDIFQVLREAPEHTTVGLPFSPGDERLRNIPLMMKVLYKREDILYKNVQIGSSKFLDECVVDWLVAPLFDEQVWSLGERDVASWAPRWIDRAVFDRLESGGWNSSEVIKSREDYDIVVSLVPSLVDLLLHGQWQSKVSLQISWVIVKFKSDAERLNAVVCY